MVMACPAYRRGPLGPVAALRRRPAQGPAVVVTVAVAAAAPAVPAVVATQRSTSTTVTKYRDGQHEQQGVEAVEQPAVAGEHRPCP